MISAHYAFAGAVKDAPVVTPLMDFVRQKRAAKGGSRVSFNPLDLMLRGLTYQK